MRTPIFGRGRPKSGRLRRVGFTLIELLVVIAIIAVLAAILFPVFAAAKASAKRTEALSNISQIGKATHMYLADYDDKLPFHFPSMTEWPGYNVIVLTIGGRFTETFAPYIKDPRVWYSPADRLSNKSLSSFAFNEQLAYAWSMSSIPRPSEAIYLTDRTDVGSGPAPDTYIWWEFIDAHPFDESKLPGKIDPVAVATQIDPIRYVGNTALYLYLDGHATSLPFEKTWGDATHNQHLATKP